MDQVNVVINELFNGLTIKEYLKKNNVGRGKIENIRVNKSSFINGVYQNLDTKLNTNDILSFKIDEEIDFVCLNEKLDVLYEDEYILIVNKKVNMIIHPDDKLKSNTLVNLIANYYKENNINRKVRFIHRIDKETSGLVLFAKDFLTEAMLLKMLQNDEIERKYLALLEGKINKKEGIINQPIATDRHVNNKMCINKNGKEAITCYKVIQEYDNFSLVEFTLKTGRTHQIRVHASFINHPLLGDVMYNGNYQYINRVALHSSSISFIHPINNKKIDVKSDLFEDMKKIIK